MSSVRALEIIYKKWERLGYRPDAEELLYTVGVNGYRMDGTTNVHEVMQELQGITPSSGLASP